MTQQHKESFSAGGVVFNKNGDICVVSQRGVMWSLPKGHLEVGEDALTTAKRETAEESGITQLKLISKLGTYSRYRLGKNGKSDDKKTLKYITLFLFTTEQMELAPTDPDNPSARWVPIDDVAPLLTHPKDKEFFLEHKNEIWAMISKERTEK